MEKIQGVISSNLRSLRGKRKLSLDDLSGMTGVSKSLLRQIEKEESNPTITTLWKIANGLKVPFTSLMKAELPDAEIVRRENMNPLVEDDGKYHLYPYFNFEDHKPFEMYSVEMEPSAKLEADPHHSGAIECITVFNGTLSLSINDEQYMLQTGDSIKFKADHPHSYWNPGRKTTTLSMIVYYPER
ncbi:helix-turn-helix domain-containing protein [Peribacillus sp. SCS-37]|uniref:helix-turn-helix domain-containing protein n=1 Tax=Paraperibacillus esterisolvens TaxID=3115296 RepID=UPI00390684BA